MPVHFETLDNRWFPSALISLSDSHYRAEESADRGFWRFGFIISLYV
jgi:hypothetical protein